MASKAGEQCEFSIKDAPFVGRFVYDVLVYTLTKCGLPETCLPTTNSEGNVYHHTNIVKIAGASALRLSLLMRDEWKEMFISRRKSYGFGNKDVLEFLKNLVLCCPRLSRTKTTQSLIELHLASCNEIIMYFHLESMDIDFNIVVKSIGECIIGIIKLIDDEFETINELFDSFDDILGYTDWITDFITLFATPYGSRDDVSYLFFEYVRQQYEQDLKKLKDGLGFLPHDLFLVVTVESENFAKPLSISSDSESPEPLASSEIGARMSDDVFEHSAQVEQSSKISLEHDFGKMSLGTEEDSQESHDTTAKSKTDPKE